MSDGLREDKIAAIKQAVVTNIRFLVSERNFKSYLIGIMYQMVVPGVLKYIQSIRKFVDHESALKLCSFVPGF